MAGIDAAEVRAIFGEASELSGAERSALLDRLCAGRPELLERVEHLLRAAETAGAFLAEPTLPSATPVNASGEPPGTVIGPYTLVRLLGRGGFGDVYEAAQSTPIERRVALKIIKPGMDTDAVIRRFEAERQTLALMSHPNIAAVLDAGATPAGRPYFVMELVPGEPITAYCDRLRLSIEERLDVFLQVCHAVQHAHQKGVIHRDLKPSNVLARRVEAGEHGSTHFVKVIDFGIAKATRAADAERLAFTQQAQMIGTPEYMSPEQASGVQDLDTRTDVYALGVLLYELLAGTTPLEATSLRSAAFAEMQRVIREVDPPAPSTRLRESQERLAAVAALRGSEPAALPGQVRGELDWIVMRSIEKERGRRYDSVGGLAQDLRRYLSHQPVEAAPPSTWYRARKFMRRHRTAVVMVSLVGAAIAAGTVGTAIGVVRAREALARARMEEQRAHAVSDFMTSTFMGVTPAVARGRDVAVLREMMSDATRRLESGELKGNPAAEAELRLTVAQVQASMEQFADARVQRTAALDLARRELGEASPVTLRATLDLASSMIESQEGTAARASIDAVLPLIDASPSAELQVRARVVRSNAIYFERAGWSQDSEDDAREALRLARRDLGPADLRTLDALHQLGMMLLAGSKTAEAEELLREASGALAARLGSSHPQTLQSRTTLADVLLIQGKSAEAETLLDGVLEDATRLYGAGTPAVADALHRRAMLMRDLGRLGESIEADTQALDIRRRVLGPMHRDVAVSLVSLARARAQSGNCVAALELARDALAIRQQLAGPDSATVASSLTDVGRVELCLGRLADARATLERAVATFARAEPRSGHRLEAMTDLGYVVQAQGDYVAAAEIYRQVLTLRLTEQPQHVLSLAHNLSELGTAIASAGKGPEAIAIVNNALAAVRSVGAEKLGGFGRVLGNAAIIHVRAGKPADGLPFARERLRLTRERVGELGMGELSLALDQLGQVELAAAQPLAARATLTEALGMRAAAGAGSDEALWTRGLLGLALAADGENESPTQGRYVEAQSHLREAYEGLAKTKPAESQRLARGLAELHERWRAIDPAGGHREAANEWRERAKP